MFLYGISGNSMEPAIRNGDIVCFTSLKARSFKNLEVGDIILFERENELLIKRIHALPGSWIIREQGLISKVSPDHYWVQGDNLKSSIDSRNFGEIELSNVIGKARRICWPPSRFSLV